MNWMGNKKREGRKAQKKEEIKMKFEHDCEHEDGKRFVLMQEAYIDGPADSRGYYVADAFCPDDPPDENGFIPVYEVYWDIALVNKNWTQKPKN